MLHLIPAPLHRLLYRIADRLRRQWWKVYRPTRNSVLVIAADGEGRVLLVRHSYGPPVWALPGGGIDRGEAPEEAARREFREELGGSLSELRELTHVTEPDSGSMDQLHVFVARAAGSPEADMREIVAAEFFDPAELPRPLDHRARRWVGEAAALLQQQ